MAQQLGTFRAAKPAIIVFYISICHNIGIAYVVQFRTDEARTERLRVSNLTNIVYGMSSPEALLGLPEHQSAKPQVTLATDTDTAERLIPAIVATFGPRVRSVRFIRGSSGDKTKHAYGAFLVNENEDVLVYIENALIGYDGAGPDLSKKLLSALGAPSSVFDTVNDMARPLEQHYGIRVFLK